MNSSLPSTTIEPIIRLAISRGVHIESDGQSLRVRGPQSAIVVLRPHLIAAKAVLVEYLAANPMPCDQSPAQQNPRGQGGLEGGAAIQSLTPLAILSHLALSGRHQPTAADIDLAMWLTQVATVVATDPDPGTIGADGSAPIRIADTVAGLARGPRTDTRPPESPAQWIERIRQFKQAVESARQWRSAEYRVRDWPAELRRPPRTVIATKIAARVAAKVADKPMESTSSK